MKRLLLGATLLGQVAVVGVCGAAWAVPNRQQAAPSLVANTDLNDLFAQAAGTATEPAQPAPAPPAVAPSATTPSTTSPTPPAVAPSATTPSTTTPAPAAPSDTQAAPAPATPDAAPATEDSLDDDISLGEIPAVETTELSLDMAKRAVDAYAMVKEKYKDADIEQYDNLQDFVDQNARGKEFEADIKAAGFMSVNDWNLAITTASFTYTNIVDDQTDEIKQQIEELKTDQEMAQDMRDRMISSLTSMIPSDNNRKIIDELIKDPAYGDKVKALQVEEE